MHMDLNIYTWSLIAICQLAFLPGFLLCRLLKIQGIAPNIVFSFALSLFSNYLFALILTYLGLYSRSVFSLIVILELLLLLLLVRNVRLLDNLRDELALWKDFFRTHAREPISMLLFAGMLYFCFIAWAGFFSNTRNVLDSYDTVYTYFPWAQYWAAYGETPAVGHYPQFMPLNWSVLLLFTGEHRVEFPIKMLTPLFSCTLLLWILDMGVRLKRHLYFLLGILFYALYMRTISQSVSMLSVLSHPISQLPVDQACVFFLCLWVLLFLSLREKKQEANIWPFLYIACAACVAHAATKRVGLFSLPLFFFWLFWLRQKLHLRGKKSLAKIFILSFAVLALVFVSYLLTEETIFLTYQKAQYTQYTLERLWPALQKLLDLHGYVILSLLLLFSFLAVFVHKESSFIFFLYALPLWLVIAVFFEGYIRYTPSITSMLAFNASIGLAYLSRKFCLRETRITAQLSRRLDLLFSIPKIKTWLLVCLIVLSIFYRGSRYTDEALLKEQNTKRFYVGKMTANVILSLLNAEAAKKGKVYTIVTDVLLTNFASDFSHLKILSTNITHGRLFREHIRMSAGDPLQIYTKATHMLCTDLAGIQYSVHAKFFGCSSEAKRRKWKLSLHDPNKWLLYLPPP